MLYYLVFLLIVGIWHNVHKEAGYTLSSIYISKCWHCIYLVFTLWTCGLISDAIISEKPSFGWGLGFEFYFFLTKDAGFLCNICGNVTMFYWLALKKSAENPLRKRQVHTKFINVIMQTHQSQKSGDIVRSIT